MASITQTQADLAAALAVVTGGAVRTLPATSPRAGDGWVNIGRVVPGSRVTTCDCTFVAVLVLGSDAARAAEQIRTLPIALIDAVTTGPFHPDGVTVEPAELPAGDVAPGSLYALILTLTLEVD